MRSSPSPMRLSPVLGPEAVGDHTAGKLQGLQGKTAS